MVRPVKSRTVCALPKNKVFGPPGWHRGSGLVVMTVDEYETLRLIDGEGLTQQECCEHIGVGRTTVQAMYDRARGKLADCLVGGKRLLIEGGEFTLCSGNHGRCRRRACRWGQEENTRLCLVDKSDGREGGLGMSVAIPVNEDRATVAGTLGRAPLFAVVDMDSGEVRFMVNSGAESQGGTGIKVAQTLLDWGVQAVVTPQCGENAANVLQAGEVELFLARGRDLSDNVSAYREGTLQKLTDVHEGYHGNGGK